MDFTPIRRLRLKEAFADNQKFQAVVCDQDFLNDLFEWTDRGIIYIHDDPASGHTLFVNDTNRLGADKTFKVINRYHTDLFLWHIDGTLYKKDSKCDCAFLTTYHLGFVEFKANAANNTESAIKENYEKASSQLTLTIKDVADRCRQIGIDLIGSTDVDAYAVFNPTVPRHNAYQKSVAAKFFLKTNGISLYFKNSTEI